MEGKAIFDDNLGATELSLAPPGTDHPLKKPVIGVKRTHDEVCRESSVKTESSETPQVEDHHESPPVAKAQVVGWPPVRAYRKNNTFQAKKSSTAAAASSETGLFVKVGMDGAPYLRKIDLKMYKGYRELKDALDAMFNCFSVSRTDQAACKDDAGGDGFAIAYEDKDGDLMLVGDVPWEMFISSCKKLRIMRGAEARG